MRRAVLIQLRTHGTQLCARIEHQVLLPARLPIGRVLLVAGLRARLLDGTLAANRIGSARAP